MSLPATRITGLYQLLSPLVRPFAGRLAVGVGAMIVSSTMMLAIGWGLKGIVDHGLSAQSPKILDHGLTILMGVIFIMAAASYVRILVIFKIAEKVTADLRRKIFSKLLVLDPAWYDNNMSGDIVSRINADTTVIQMVMTTNLPTTFRHVLMLVGGIGMLFYVSPAMTVMTLVAVPLVIAPCIFLARHVRRKSRDSQERVGDMSSYAQEAIQGLQTLQSFGHETIAAKVFGDRAENAYLSAMKYIRLRAFMTSFVIFIILCAIGVALWRGGHLVLAGEMSGGDLSAFIFYALMLAGAVTAISEAMSDISRASGAADRIISVLEAQPVVKKGNAVLPRQISGAVSFDNVSFSYPARMEQQALAGVSFKAAPGSITALVGPSGAGKTTVFQLLQRFYDPSFGRITIDGIDICDCDPADVRRVMGVVSQDPAIFSASIADNIRIGKPEATDAEIRRAADQAQAAEFIDALPQGYETHVGEGGSRLSGGQKQRIAIARAFLKNPRILLLDEATSALDSSNEAAVHAALHMLMEGRTTMIIAHRLATVQGADNILVFDAGRITGQGSHAELYGLDTLYTHLASLQAAI